MIICIAECADYEPTDVTILETIIYIHRTEFNTTMTLPDYRATYGTVALVINPGTARLFLSIIPEGPNEMMP